jgi:hypothetical protein
MNLTNVADEVLMLFTNMPEVNGQILVRIEAASPIGFDDGMKWTVRANCNRLRIKSQVF